jgi:hypothetical protein
MAAEQKFELLVLVFPSLSLLLQSLDFGLLACCRLSRRAEYRLAFCFEGIEIGLERAEVRVAEVFGHGENFADRIKAVDLSAVIAVALGKVLADFIGRCGAQIELGARQRACPLSLGQEMASVFELQNKDVVSLTLI